MTPGMYSAASVLEARFKAQETISKNLASSQVNGYKRQVTSFYGFASELYDAVQSQSDGPETASGVQEVLPYWDMTNGMLKHTGRQTDFAIKGEGFFVVETPKGNMLTRDGHFHVTQEGMLVTTNGMPVLSANGPIEVPAGEDFFVKADGTLHTQDGEVGQLQIVRPDNFNAIDSYGGGLWRLGENNGVQEIESPHVAQGYLEQSNVNIPQEMVAMLANSRLAEMATKVLQASDQSLGSAIQDLSA